MNKSNGSTCTENPLGPGERPPAAPTRDTHALPPNHICDAYWKYNKAKAAEIDADATIIDWKRGLSDAQRRKLKVTGRVEAKDIAKSYMAFHNYGYVGTKDEMGGLIEPHACTIYEHVDFPGLRLYPSLLPQEAQLLLVSRIMHRDLANSHHKTNIDLEYHVPYPVPAAPSSSQLPPVLSFFASRQSSTDQMLIPKDKDFDAISENRDPDHKLKSLNMSQFLQKKLRWLTLGDQYKWSTRSYSGADTTPFPPDIAQLITGLFTWLKPESGVVLLYSKTDYMPVHRDVSEVCERGLVSLSLGCDGLFIVASDTIGGEKEISDGKVLVIRVRSGDVVEMAGKTRWAWHAMPKIIAGTCPDFMEDWPAGSEVEMGEKRGTYEQWKGYMAGKRINLSCRQVWDL